jgi:hypothetical protein
MASVATTKAEAERVVSRYWQVNDQANERSFAGRPTPDNRAGVIASLALPAARPAASQPVSPLPLTGFHQLPRDASMLYDIGRVDASGRVASGTGLRPRDRVPAVGPGRDDLPLPLGQA